MAKRIGGSSINWTQLAERVPPAQKASFVAFKTRSDLYLRRVLANPEAPPKIDWAAYNTKIGGGLVESLKKSYEGLSIPYPPDSVSSQIDSQEKELKDAIAKYVATSKESIKKHEAEILKLESLIPYSEMTMEEFGLAHPELAVTPDRPTFWPHLPEFQYEYVMNLPDEGEH